jgi:hypothetical protein
MIFLLHLYVNLLQAYFARQGKSAGNLEGQLAKGTVSLAQQNRLPVFRLE